MPLFVLETGLKKEYLDLLKSYLMLLPMFLAMLLLDEKISVLTLMSYSILGSLVYHLVIKELVELK